MSFYFSAYMTILKLIRSIQVTRIQSGKGKQKYFSKFKYDRSKTMLTNSNDSNSFVSVSLINHRSFSLSIVSKIHEISLFRQYQNFKPVTKNVTEIQKFYVSKQKFIIAAYGKMSGLF